MLLKWSRTYGFLFLSWLGFGHALLELLVEQFAEFSEQVNRGNLYLTLLKIGLVAQLSDAIGF